MRRRWTGGSIQKVKIAKRDKAMRQHEYFEKKKGDYGTNIPKRIDEAVFQNFTTPAAEGEVPDPPSLDKSEAYMSKDYLLLTSRASNKPLTTKSELVVEQIKDEPTQLDPIPVQMPTTIASDIGAAPRLANSVDRDEGLDRTEDVYRALHAERLLLVQSDSVVLHHNRDLYPEVVVDKLGYNQLLNAALLMREQ